MNPRFMLFKPLTIMISTVTTQLEESLLAFSIIRWLFSLCNCEYLEGIYTLKLYKYIFVMIPLPTELMVLSQNSCSVAFTRVDCIFPSSLLMFSCCTIVRLYQPFAPIYYVFDDLSTPIQILG